MQETNESTCTYFRLPCVEFLDICYLQLPKQDGKSFAFAGLAVQIRLAPKVAKIIGQQETHWVQIEHLCCYVETD